MSGSDEVPSVEPADATLLRSARYIEHAQDCSVWGTGDESDACTCGLAGYLARLRALATVLDGLTRHMVDGLLDEATEHVDSIGTVPHGDGVLFDIVYNDRGRALLAVYHALLPLFPSPPDSPGDRRGGGGA